MAAEISVDRHFVAHALLIIVITACFLLGGSARGDVESLVVLRPLVAVALTGGLLCLSGHDLKRHRFLLGFSASLAALPLVHLIPLPPGVWARLPGRELIAEIDRVAGLGAVWRPLTLAPEATWNAFYASLVPLAVIVLGVHLGQKQRQFLLPLVLALAACSVLVGLMQVRGPPDGALYFYRVTNNGVFVGMFANRNHQALLVAMMLPMLGVLAAPLTRGSPKQRVVGLSLVAGGVALLPVLLMIGSRMGLIVGVAAILVLPALVGTRPIILQKSKARPHQELPPRYRRIAAWALAVVGAGVAALTVSWGQGKALDRLLYRAVGSELRLQIIPTIKSMIVRYWPTGSGVGSFEKAYKINEPDALLGPEYVNHAHNDVLEVLVTTGAVGLVMFAVAAYAFVLAARRAWSAGGSQNSDRGLAKLGIVLIFLAALASFGDYPLRAPSLAAVFAVAVLWASCPAISVEHA